MAEIALHKPAPDTRGKPAELLEIQHAPCRLAGERDGRPPGASRVGAPFAAETIATALLDGLARKEALASADAFKAEEIG